MTYIHLLFLSWHSANSNKIIIANICNFVSNHFQFTNSKQHPSKDSYQQDALNEHKKYFCWFDIKVLKLTYSLVFVWNEFVCKKTPGMSFSCAHAAIQASTTLVHDVSTDVFVSISDFSCFNHCSLGCYCL